jgi:hypothetical protein
MDPIFACAKCVGERVRIDGGRPRWATLPGPIGHSQKCAACGAPLGDETGEVYMLVENKVTCVACKKLTHADKAVMCPRCLAVGACSLECWLVAEKAHMDFCSREPDIGSEFAEEDGGDGVGAPRAGGAGPRISPAKARQMLHDKEVRGHPLTPRQVRYFGYLASKGKKT